MRRRGADAFACTRRASPYQRVPLVSAVVTIGETMGLVTPYRIGRLGESGDLCVKVAGAESNVAIGLARLGVPVTWMGRVGDDELGRLVIRELRAEGVSVRAIVDECRATGLMLKTRPRSTKTTVTYFRSDSAGAALSPHDIDLDEVRNAGVLHVTGITVALSSSARSAIRSAIEAAHGSGTLVSLDINYRSALWSAAAAHDELRRMLPHVDILFAGEEEADVVMGTKGSTTRERLSALSALGPRTVLLKRGSHGAVGRFEDEMIEQAATAVEVVDPVGAGDAFAAGYLSALVEGLPAVEALHRASVAGALACTSIGDWEGAPTYDEIARVDADPDAVSR